MLAPPLQQMDRTFVKARRRKLIYFGGCDYFRLASHPAILRALVEGTRKFGLNVAASRATTGNHRLYEKLEAELARFFQAESAVLVSSGYASNLVVAQALAGEFTHVLIDRRAHASLHDAAELFRCPVVPFKPQSADDLTRQLRRYGRSARPIVLTDGMFAHDGSVAPLSGYLSALPPHGWILVDDAHGAGVLGDHGRGSLEWAGVARRRIIQTITLSKAFGAYGGAVLGPRSLRAKILSCSRLFIGNTPVPLPLASAALAALNLVRKQPELRQRLTCNSAYVKERLRRMGWAFGDAPGPIIPWVPRKDREALALKRRLLSRGIHPPFIQYPGSPPAGFFRFVISSEHTPQQLDTLIEALVDQASSPTK